MDPLSRDLEKAEFDASHHPSSSKPGPGPAHRSASFSSSNHSSSSSSSFSSHSRFHNEDDYISRIQTAQTQRSTALERHPTAISRIATHRSQHSATVGATLKTRPSKLPLPEFGAGKPYPPPLPSQEEYVVEFSGPDDPLHPQNWSTKKKWVVFLFLAI